MNRVMSEIPVFARKRSCILCCAEISSPEGCSGGGQGRQVELWRNRSLLPPSGGETLQSNQMVMVDSLQRGQDNQVTSSEYSSSCHPVDILLCFNQPSIVYCYRAQRHFKYWTFESNDLSWRWLLMFGFVETTKNDPLKISALMVIFWRGRGEKAIQWIFIRIFKIALFDKFKWPNSLLVPTGTHFQASSQIVVDNGWVKNDRRNSGGTLRQKEKRK